MQKQNVKLMRQPKMRGGGD